MLILVTGGVRSGKSRHAESLLADQSVTYVAAGPAADADDADWAARVAAHRLRRPSTWRTIETTDLAQAIGGADQGVLVDCLATWLTATLDSAHAWEAVQGVVDEVIDSALAPVLEALRATTHDVVLVTNEVGLGVIPAHRSGRLFRDCLGLVNQRVAAVCDEVHLVVAGRVLRL